MKRQDLVATLFLATTLLGPVSPASAQTAAAAVPLAVDTEESHRAEALLRRAVTHLRTHGSKALADFSVSGQFVDGDLYVYVLGTDGVLQASGGPSFHMIGRNVLEYRDPDGKPLFAEILAGARRDGRGLIHYRWLNPQRGTVERKAAYYQAVEDYIAAVGYYAPRATPEQAMSILWRAVDELQRRGPASFEAFNDLNGGFVRDDTY
ncbi:MAG: cache domain-containing protein [Thauera propionica]|jgi:cytochrome c|nr:cache domain-containing protein [Thauera propionica]